MSVLPTCLIVCDAKQNIKALLKCADKYSLDERVKIQCGFTSFDQWLETNDTSLWKKGEALEVKICHN